MKKILFASTALVAFTGAAAADVALSGRAEMGVYNPAGAPSWQFFTDIDVTFTMTGETDSGLTFGASVDLDEADGPAANNGVSGATGNNSDDGGATIFISGSFGTVTMGDTDGALDWALTEAGNVGNPGSIADDETSHAGYFGSYHDGGNDGQILRWDYTAGDFGVAISLEDDNGSRAANTNLGYAVGLKYNIDLGGTVVALGVGYQERADAVGITAKPKAAGVSASATLANGFSAGITYTKLGSTAIGPAGAATPVDNHVGLGLGYTSGAISVHANYGKFSGTTGNPDRSGVGLSAAYDLGGGAVVHAGYGQGKVGNGPTSKTASLGLGLSF
ncbi:MAG: porin [Pseudomonadota bacterium]